MSDEALRERQPEGAAWSAPAGFPVYGVTKGAPVPDLEQPWSFNPGGVPQPPPQQEQLYIQQPAPATAEPPPYAQQQPAQPQWVDPRLPSPLGPALTPEERYNQLFPPTGQ